MANDDIVTVLSETTVVFECILEGATPGTLIQIDFGDSNIEIGTTASRAFTTFTTVIFTASNTGGSASFKVNIAVGKNNEVLRRFLKSKSERNRLLRCAV